MARQVIRIFATALAMLPCSMAIAGDPVTQPADAAATTEPADKMKQLHEARRAAVRDQWMDAPILQTLALHDLIHFSLYRNYLHADVAPVGEPAPARIAVRDSQSLWTITRRGTAPIAAGAANLLNQSTLTRFDLIAGPDEPWQTTLNLSDRSIFITASRDDGDITLIQIGGSVRLRVMEAAEFGKPVRNLITLQGLSLVDLRAQHPRQFRTYVTPLLSRFSDLGFLLPGPADVYATFTDIPAEASSANELQQIIPDLDAEDPAERQSASDRLARLGARGVLAAIRCDQSELTEEQKSRIRAFIFAARLRPNLSPVEARQDRTFLIDCLEYSDPAVRSAAKDQLQRLIGREVNFDVTQPVDARAQAADALREQLLSQPPPAALPATRPAQ